MLEFFLVSGSEWVTAKELHGTDCCTILYLGLWGRIPILPIVFFHQPCGEESNSLLADVSTHTHTYSQQAYCLQPVS